MSFKFNSIDSPCYKCEDRTIKPVNCHSVCQKYLDYRAKCNEESEKNYKEKSIDKLINGMIRDGATAKRKTPLQLKHGRHTKK